MPSSGKPPRQRGDADGKAAAVSVWTPPATLPERLTVARRIAGLSQSAAAARSGVSRPTLVRYESGTSVPRLDKLQLLADAYGCSLDDLLVGAER
jgi:transcriptional regulator with XRE-family HTH domain